MLSIRWLEYVAYTEGLVIQHAQTSEREATAGPYKVDGLARLADGRLVVYEFCGCYWHGHESCFPQRCDARWKQQRKAQQLRELGFEVCSFWECEFRYLESHDALCKAFFEEFGERLRTPLNVRDAFYGGRTNASCLYHKVVGEEVIRYVDICSLYPSVNKSARYTCGHAVKLLKPSLATLYARKYFGVARVRVIPPVPLFHPVLPVRINGKLMFPLCYACATTTSAQCSHTRDQRALLGSRCTPEIYKALDLGYDVTSVYEVHHFENSKVGLFAEYVNTFLCGKQEASG